MSHFDIWIVLPNLEFGEFLLFSSSRVAPCLIHWYFPYHRIADFLRLALIQTLNTQNSTTLRNRKH